MLQSSTNKKIPVRSENLEVRIPDFSKLLLKSPAKPSKIPSTGVHTNNNQPNNDTDVVKNLYKSFRQIRTRSLSFQGEPQTPVKTPLLFP